MKIDNNLPIYIQLVEYIKIQIISGKMQPGERILSVRELASVFKANPNTVQKAMQELEEIGLIYTERTNGKFVTENVKIINKIRESYAIEVVNNFFDGMQNIGYDKNDAIKYLNKIKGEK